MIKRTEGQIWLKLTFSYHSSTPLKCCDCTNQTLSI